MSVIHVGGPLDGQVTDQATVRTFEVPPGGGPNSGVHRGSYVPTGDVQDGHAIYQWEPIEDS